MAITLHDRLADIIVRGAKAPADLLAAAVSGHITLDTSDATSVTFGFADPDLRILSSNLLTCGTLTQRGAEVDYQGLRLEVGATEIGPGIGDVPVLTATCRSRGIGSLKRRVGPLTMRNASPSEFVIAECRAVGLSVVAQPSAKKSQITRDVRKAGDGANIERPSSWTTFQRLAGEVGFYVFESFGTVYFGQPTYLIQHAGTTARIDWLQPAQGQKGWTADQLKYRALKAPHCRRTADNYVAVTIDAEIPYTRAAEFHLGARLDLRGVPLYEGTNNMVTRIDYDLAGENPVAISSQTPHDADIAATGAKGSQRIPSGSFGATKSATDFVAVALAQVGKTYTWAATPAPTDADPQAFDCSSLVQWALARVGITGFPRNSAVQFAACIQTSVDVAYHTPGALLFVSDSTTAGKHVGISMGDGNRTIEALNPNLGVRVCNRGTSPFDVAGFVPGLIQPKSGS